MLVFFALDVAVGSVTIPMREVVTIVFGGTSTEPAWINIVQKIRLPKAMTAVLVGMALSVGGLQMQTLFRNPLAGPSVLGVTAGASLGVAAVMLASGSAATLMGIRQFGLSGSWLLVMAATLGAAAVLGLVLLISLRVRDYVVVLIVGLMVGNLTLALVSLWQYFSAPAEIQDYLLWTFGSLGGVTQAQLWTLALVVGLGLLLTLGTVKPLNALLLGEEYARTLGLTVRRIRLLIIAATSLLAGSVTAFCGPIGFIGIAVPHLARALFHTADHRVLLPATALIGAALMLLCDVIAQWPGSATALPINAITALFGSPVVIWVILRRRHLKSHFA